MINRLKDKKLYFDMQSKCITAFSPTVKEGKLKVDQ